MSYGIQTTNEQKKAAAKMRQPYTSNYKLLHVALGDPDAVQNLFLAAFESLVLHLDAGAAIETDIGQRGNILAPVHIAVAGQLGGHVVQGVGHDAVVIELVLVDLDVLEVDVEDLVLELIQRLDVINSLPDEVAGIVVQAEVRRIRNGEQLAPDSGVVIRF